MEIILQQQCTVQGGVVFCMTHRQCRLVLGSSTLRHITGGIDSPQVCSRLTEASFGK